jgi:hypothetical protein
MGKAIGVATLHSATFMVNRDQNIRTKLLNIGGEFGQLTTISKISTKQNNTASEWMQNPTTIICVQNLTDYIQSNWAWIHSEFSHLFLCMDS